MNIGLRAEGKQWLRLTRTSGGKALRTESVTGLGYPPVVGHRFSLMGDPLDPDASVRLVQTSPVTNVEWGEGAWVVVTQSGSVYMIETLETHE